MQVETLTVKHRKRCMPLVELGLGSRSRAEFRARELDAQVGVYSSDLCCNFENLTFNAISEISPHLLEASQIYFL